MKDKRFSSAKAARLGAVLAVMVVLPAAVQGQQMFDSPQAALDGLKAAVQADNKEALRQIFGPQVDELKSGDPVQDAADLEGFAARLKGAARLEEAGPGQMTVLVGSQEHPFAVPLVRKEGKWFFDTAAGREELENRRVGQNELGAISVCRAYVVAQREYYMDDDAGTGVPEYAQRLRSTQGKHDGLYWETRPDEATSPLGPLIAQAHAEGYVKQKPGAGEQPQPYHGYVYKILTRQGKAAPGGKYDYIINRHMVAGFALIAYPVNWGSSGVMTFLVGPAGNVYQKDLGERTSELVTKMKEYDPDNSWTLIQN